MARFAMGKIFNRSLAVLALFATARPAAADEFISVTDSTFKAEVEEASSRQPVLVFFQAEWCGPCRMMRPALAEFARENKCKLVAVDVDKNPALPQRFGVSSLPMTLAFRNGEMTATLRGAGTKQGLRALLPAQSR